MTHPTLQEKPLAFLDIETTGLTPPNGEIIEIAIIVTMPPSGLRNRLLGRRQVVFEYVTKVAPKHPETAHPKALEVNGYNAEEWEGAPALEAVLPVAVTILEKCVIAGQNVRVDAGFLSYYREELDVGSRFDYHLVDTVTLAYEHIVPCGAKKISLKDICTFIGIKPEPDQHRALAGARTDLKVYERLARAGVLDRLYWKMLAKV